MARVTRNMREDRAAAALPVAAAGVVRPALWVLVAPAVKATSTHRAVAAAETAAVHPDKRAVLVEMAEIIMGAQVGAQLPEAVEVTAAAVRAPILSQQAMGAQEPNGMQLMVLGAVAEAVPPQEMERLAMARYMELAAVDQVAEITLPLARAPQGSLLSPTRPPEGPRQSPSSRKTRALPQATRPPSPSPPPTRTTART